MASTCVAGRPLSRSSEASASARVEPGRRFVHQEQARPADQDAGQADAAFLARRQVMRRPVCVAVQADGRQRVAHGPVDLGGGPAPRARAVAHVFADGEADQLVVGILEHDADAIADAAGWCRA